MRACAGIGLKDDAVVKPLRATILASAPPKEAPKPGCGGLAVHAWGWCAVHSAAGGRRPSVVKAARGGEGGLVLQRTKKSIAAEGVDHLFRVRVAHWAAAAARCPPHDRSRRSASRSWGSSRWPRRSGTTAQRPRPQARSARAPLGGARRTRSWMRCARPAARRGGRLTPPHVQADEAPPQRRVGAWWRGLRGREPRLTPGGWLRCRRAASSSGSGRGQKQYRHQRVEVRDAHSGACIAGRLPPRPADPRPGAAGGGVHSAAGRVRAAGAATPAAGRRISRYHPGAGVGAGAGPPGWAGALARAGARWPPEGRRRGPATPVGGGKVRVERRVVGAQRVGR